MERTLAIAVGARTSLLASRFAVAGPVCPDITGVAHGQRVVIRRIAQRLDHFEGDRLLTLGSVRVDGIDERNTRALGGKLHEPHAVVEIAADLNYDRPVH